MVPPGEKIAQMVLAGVGAGVLSYGFLYSVALLFIDCDLELWFYSKFGKSPKTLKGKVVCITGASSGIGEYTAKALARHGVRLALTARSENELQRVRRECLELSQGKLTQHDILVVSFDITDLAQQTAAFDRIVQHFGTLDVLLNNAGRSQRAIFEDIHVSVDRQLFELNVFATVHFSRMAVRYFNRKGSGHVAVMSSVAGILDMGNSATYTAAKHALHGYFGALRTEKIGKGVDVTVLCPGPTLTNFLQESFTGTEGEKYGIPARKSDKRMTAERCGHLCAVALANRTRESWMGVYPMMPLAYMFVYFPIWSRILLKCWGPERIYRFRDSKDITVGKV